MKISKHVHSCLLVEEEGERFLIDPGNYTFEENALDLNVIESLDYLLITHEHPDHMHISGIIEVVKKFPDIKVISNTSVAKILSEQGIKVKSSGDELVSLVEVPHEKVFGPNQPPQNVLITVAGKLTHPGDSLHFNLNTPILAMPIQAPWCSTTEAVEKALELRPKVIIPIHDWHWNEKARENMYKRLTDFFAGQGIEFKGLKTGEVVEISLL